MKSIPFQILDWSQIPETEHAGQTGKLLQKTVQFEGLRIRQVSYSEGYLADHWCAKGHLVYCLEGSFVSELDSGERFELNANESYIVSDNRSLHRSYSQHGVKLLIVDGDFLK